MLSNMKDILYMIFTLYCTLTSTKAESNDSSITGDKDVCENSCRLVIPYSDFARCQCSATDGNDPCMYGCQTVMCRCPGMPWKTCQIWCDGFSLFHGCDCSRTWDLRPLEPSTTRKPFVRRTTTTSVDVFVEPDDYSTTRHPSHGNQGASPAAIGSIVAALVVVLIVVAVVTVFVQRKFICQKTGRDLNRPQNEYNRNRRFLGPMNTPSAPPSYEDTIRQCSRTDASSSRAPAYVENPPPYSSSSKPPSPPAAQRLRASDTSV